MVESTSNLLVNALLLSWVATAVFWFRARRVCARYRADYGLDTASGNVFVALAAAIADCEERDMRLLLRRTQLGLIGSLIAAVLCSGYMLVRTVLSG